MRDVIFIVILVTLAGLGIFHVMNQAWFELSIDAALALYALRSWRPKRPFFRR